MFDATTSLGWDTGRAITNALLILVAGAPVLAALRRAARRASFGAPVEFVTGGRDRLALTAVDVDLPAEDDPRRIEVRALVRRASARRRRRNSSTRATSCRTGPRPYGLDADPALQLIIEDEMRRAGVSKPMNPIGIGHCGPILVALGNDEQKQRYLWPMLTGEELWCQLFSEPGAGSDLASLSTRAMRDGDVYVVNGQKIWTSLAAASPSSASSSRARAPTARSTRGISYFIIPMDVPGIEVRPIKSMTGEGGFGFNEVFFTDVRVPGREPHRRGEPRLGHGEDHARQRARVALDRRRAAVGLRPERARSRRALSATAAASTTPCAASRSSTRTSKARSCATTACA